MPDPQNALQNQAIESQPNTVSQVASLFDGLRVKAANAFQGVKDTASEIYHHPDQAISDARQAVNQKVGDVVGGLETEAKNVVLDPHARANFLVGLVQPGGEGMPEEFSGLRVKKATEGIEPQSINPQEIADLQSQNPGKVIRPEDVSQINRQQAAQKNIDAGLKGERGDEASQIREEHRAALEPKKIIQDAGLVYKGELTPDSNVHMFEHPDHPGKTVAIKGAEVSPQTVKQKMADKLREFGIATQALGK